MEVNFLRNKEVLLVNLLERARLEMPDVQEEKLKAAQENGDTETAAIYARAIRNRLLNESDKDMTLDRLTASFDFTGALKFVSSLHEILTGETAQYRQALRDIPTLPGFPLDFVFPENPNAKKPEDGTEVINDSV